MIELISVQKNYGKKKIITEATCTYEKGRIYGLAGYNGSGKTTLLKTIAGIYRPDGGKILADGAPAHKNNEFRRDSFLMTEELFFDPQSSMNDMRNVYRGYYSSWEDDIYDKLLHIISPHKLCRKSDIKNAAAYAYIPSYTPSALIFKMTDIIVGRAVTMNIEAAPAVSLIL